MFISKLSLTLCFILSCSVFNVLSLDSLVECPFILPSSLPFVKLFLVLFYFFLFFTLFLPLYQRFFHWSFLMLFYDLVFIEYFRYCKKKNYYTFILVFIKKKPLNKGFFIIFYLAFSFSTNV